MLKSTHKAGGMLVSVVGFTLLKEKGLLLDDVNLGVQWLVMYPFTIWGSVASDLDHHWGSCPTKDYPSWFIHKLLHLGKPIRDATKHNKSSFLYKISDLFTAKHRSWQTHSELTVFFMVYLLDLFFNTSLWSLSMVDISILRLIVTGITLGVLAHLALDSITPEGIHLVIFKLINKVLKFKLLPEKIKSPSGEFFASGGKWEHIVKTILSYLTVISIVYLCFHLFVPYLPIEISFN